MKLDRKLILGDEPGLGKTIMGLQALPAEGAQLVVAPKFLIPVWEREAERHGFQTFRYEGVPKSRKANLGEWWSHILPGDRGGHLVLSTYNMAEELYDVSFGLRKQFTAVIFDEAHKVRNRKTSLYDGAIKLAKKATYVYPMTGSPVVGSATDLWTLLKLVETPLRPVEPYWIWVKSYLDYTDAVFGGLNIFGPREPREFAKYLHKYMMRRTKKQVLPQLPPKVRIVLPVQMTPFQDRVYRDLWDELISEISEGELIVTPSRIGSITRVRQLLVSPTLLGAVTDERSPAIDACVEAVLHEAETGQSCVVFTPYVGAIPLIQDRLAKLPVFHIQGGTSTSITQAAIDGFQRTEGPACLIMSLQSSLGFTATKANTAIFVGYDWTPAINGQAEDRIHRIGQEDSVRCIYIAYDDTVDEHIMDILDAKTSLTDIVYAEFRKRKKDAYKDAS
jgi:SNF2 family DNA or RNA helicase